MQRPGAAGRPAAILGGAGRERIVGFLAGINRLPPLGVFLAGLLLLAGVGLIDQLVGAHYSFSIFYTFIVIAVSATGRNGYAQLTAAAAAAVWGVADVVNKVLPDPVLSFLWNGAARFAVLSFSALLVAVVVSTARDERETSRRCPLTGLLNRRGFADLAEHEVARAARAQRALAAVYLDVDGFKSVNDTHGHAAGDRLLACVASTACEQVRCSDVVARIGGDEFVVLLPDTGPDAALVVAERLRSGLDEMSRREGGSVRYSIGVATFVQAPPSVDQLLAEGDRLMYEAKRRGKDTGRSTVVAEVVGAGAQASGASETGGPGPPSRAS